MCINFSSDITCVKLNSNVTNANCFSSFVSVFVRSNFAQIKHVILSSDRFRLFFFHFSIVMCFFVTKSVTLTCCAPLILVGARYYYSRKVIQSYLDCALHTDMADIEAYYMTPTGKEDQSLNRFHSVVWVMLLHQRFFFFPFHMQKFREPIKYRSSLVFSPLLPLLPFSPPSPTHFLYELSSVMGWEGAGRRGWRRRGLMLLAGTAETFRGARFLWRNFWRQSVVAGDDALAPQMRLDAARQKAGVSWANQSPFPPPPPVFSLTPWPPW